MEGWDGKGGNEKVGKRFGCDLLRNCDMRYAFVLAHTQCQRPWSIESNAKTSSSSSSRIGMLRTRSRCMFVSVVAVQGSDPIRAQT